MESARLYKQIDVMRNVWDPTEVRRHSRYGERPFSMITGVEVHWTGTGAFQDHGDTASELLSFERYHEVSKGWYDLFYQVGIDSQGITYEGRNATIPSQGSLKNWLTVLFVMGEDDPAPPVEMYQRLYDIWGAVDPKRRAKSLRGHRERPSSTACPGNDITIGLELLRGGWNPYGNEGSTMEFSELPQKPASQKGLNEIKGVNPRISDGTNPGALAARWEAILMSNRAYVESKKEAIAASKKYTDAQIKKAIGNIAPTVEVDTAAIVAEVRDAVIARLDGSTVTIQRSDTAILDL